MSIFLIVSATTETAGQNSYVKHLALGSHAHPYFQRSSIFPAFSSFWKAKKFKKNLQNSYGLEIIELELQ